MAFAKNPAKTRLIPASAVDLMAPNFYNLALTDDAGVLLWNAKKKKISITAIAHTPAAAEKASAAIA